MAEKKKSPSLEVPSIRLDPATHEQVVAESRRRRIETGEATRYGDTVRALVRDGLCMPSARVEVSLNTAAEIAGISVGTLLSLRGGDAPAFRSTLAGRMYPLASLLRWAAAELRVRQAFAAEVQAVPWDGVSRG